MELAVWLEALLREHKRVASQSHHRACDVSSLTLIVFVRTRLRHKALVTGHA
jgi:hypothetical protein